MAIAAKIKLVRSSRRRVQFSSFVAVFLSQDDLEQIATIYLFSFSHRLARRWRGWNVTRPMRESNNSLIDIFHVRFNLSEPSSVMTPPSPRGLLWLDLPGDYCDCGPETRKVIDFLIPLPEDEP